MRVLLGNAAESDATSFTQYGRLFHLMSVCVRVLSHLPHLVQLNRTRVCFPSWCGSFGQVRMQQSHSGAHQKRTKHAYRDFLEEVVSVRFQTNPGAVRLW